MNDTKFKDLLKISQHQMKHILAEMNEQEKDANKNKYYLALAIRNLLIVAFAILFVGGARTIFGVNNTSVAVAYFCIMLQAQYVNYGYNIKATIANLGVMSCIFAVDTLLVPHNNPAISLLLNLVFLSIIVLCTCDNPRLGNVAVYIDSYLFTTFFEVHNMHEYRLRLIEIVIGFVICAVVFYCFHKDHNKDVKFIDRLKTFDIKSKKTHWQMKLVIGMSMALLVGQLLNIPRYFWIAIAGFSVLAPYEEFKISSRVFQRIFGAVVGSVMFAILYWILPKNLGSLIGPIGGFIIGFSTTYHWSSAFNCFGALALASSIYGAKFSIGLRIFNNFLGCLIATVSVIIFYEIVKRKKLYTHDYRK